MGDSARYRKKCQVLLGSSIRLGFVGILHDTGKMLGFVKFYAAGGAEVCVCLSWNWLNLSIKSLFGGMDAPTASETPL